VLIKLDDAALQVQLAQAQAALAAARADYDLLAAGPTAEQVRQAEAALMAATANFSRTVSGARQADIAAAQAAFNAANAAYQKVNAGPQPEDVASAEANLRSAQAAVRQAQAAYDDAFRRDPAGIGASPAALALEQATNAFIAAKALYDKATRPPDQAQVAAALQQVESARAALERARRPASAFDIAQAQAQVEEAQAQLDALKAGPRSQQLDAAKAQVAAAQAQLQAIETQMKKLTLRAPITGTVSKVNVQPGEWVTPGQPVAALADLDHLRVETTDLSERDIPRVKLGQPVTVFVKALNQDVTGRVSEISPLADTLGGDVVYKTTIDLDTRPTDLRPGMSVEVQFGEK
jgi:multidrug resistance efflux pump